MITMKTTNGEWKKNINSNLIQMFRFVVLSVCLYSNSGMLQCENMNEINGIKKYLTHQQTAWENWFWGEVKRTDKKNYTKKGATKKKKDMKAANKANPYLLTLCLHTSP